MIKLRLRQPKRPEAEKFDPKADYRDYDGTGYTPPREETPPIIPIIDKTLSKCQLEHRRAFVPPARHGGARAKFVVHPSQAQGCPRKVQFATIDARKDEKPPDAQLQRIFDMGHELHRMVQGYLFEAWRRRVGGVTRVWEDVKLRIDDLGVHGELDAVVEVHGIRAVIEVKTASSNVFGRLAGPKDEWVWQAHLYMRALGLRHGVILVICRDNGALREYPCDFDDKLWRAIEESILEVWEATQLEELLDTDPAPGECHWCNYTQVCKSSRLQSQIKWGHAEAKEG